MFFSSLDGSPQEPWEGGQFCYPKSTGEEREAPTVQVTGPSQEQEPGSKCTLI